MPKLFSSQSKKFLIQIDKPEKELNKFICDVNFEDRVRPGQKKKGSLGTERYEVYLKNIEDIMLFENFLVDKLSLG